MTTSKADRAKLKADLFKQKTELSAKIEAIEKQEKEELEGSMLLHEKEVREFLQRGDMTVSNFPFLPNHNLVYCTDENTEGGYIDENDGFPRCARCFLIKLINNKELCLPNNSRLVLRFERFS